MAIPTLEATVQRMKCEVIGEVLDLRIPVNVQSFGDLHDYIDANELGGLAEDELSDELIAHFGGRDKDEGMPAGMLDYINDAQSAIHDWIASGGLAGTVARHRVTKPTARPTLAEYGELLTKHKAAVRALDRIRSAGTTSATTIYELRNIANKAWREAQ